MSWKEEVLGTADKLPPGTELVVRSSQSTESVMGRALARLGGTLVKTVAGVPMAVVGQEVGQRVGLFPKTRKEAVDKICSESESWRNTVSELFGTDPQYRRVGEIPILNSGPSVARRTERIIPRHGLVDRLARELVGGSTFESVDKDLNAWMIDVAGGEVTTKERTEADRLEDSITSLSKTGHEVGFDYLINWLRSSWRQSRSEMWAGKVVDPFVTGIRNDRIEQVLNNPVPLAHVGGKDLVLAGIAGGYVPDLEGVLTGGVDVEIRNDRVVATVGKERRTVSTVPNRDVDVGNISDPIEMVASGRKSGKLSGVVSWMKRHRALPKVGLKPIGVKLFPEKKEPTEVLPAAEVNFGSLQQESEALRLPVYDAPGVYASVEETVGVYERLKRMLQTEGGRKSRSELREILYREEDGLKADFVPRPEVVISFSPSARQIWERGPDMDGLISRLINDEEVSGLEAKRALEIMEDRRTGEPLFRKIEAAYGGDSLVAKREYNKIMQMLREKIV